MAKWPGPDFWVAVFMGANALLKAIELLLRKRK